ncbi:MAG: GerMN domain-containing protein [Clostridia bacterium]|nr:GerMN domain-containing protein [Clostridia bacterium]
MTKKTAAFLLCLALLLTACGKSTENGGSNVVTLYFMNQEQNAMVTETRTVPDGTKDVAEYALRELLNGPQASDHKRVIPENTRLLGVELDGDLAKVNLSAEFDTGDDAAKPMSRGTLKNTVCAVDGIEKVLILVDGKELTYLSTGEPVGILGKDDLITDTEKLESEIINVTLYFADSNAMYLVPEKRQIVSKDSSQLELAIMNELLKGPLSDGLYAVVSPDVKVLSAKTERGVCFVNLSSDFISKSSGGSAGELLSVYSIVNSLCELKDVDKVQILIEGKATESFGSLDLSEPLKKNKDLLNN